MMSQRSKHELAQELQARYLKATRLQKTQILNEFVANTGYHRKHAIRLLKRGRFQRAGKRRGRRPQYRGEVVISLQAIWEISGRICSLRLRPFLPELVEALERHGELTLRPEIKTQLLQMSRATIDRCLQPVRFEKRKGLSTTKPGSLLKRQIPVRTFADWDDAQPGFMEVDLVAHCGDSASGQFLNTLACTDIATGWTECLAVLYRSQKKVFAAIRQLRQRLPFALLGLDSDNGSEFINDLLLGYCRQEQITFTRSRPYKKNDQAHVEQKNWSVVRRTVGYDRLEGEQEYQLLQSIYDDLRLYVNFFQPVVKLISKQRLGDKTIKHYDEAQTPYRRVCASQQVPLEVKARLARQYLTLNPTQLKRSIDEKVAKLWKLSR